MRSLSRSLTCTTLFGLSLALAACTTDDTEGDDHGDEDDHGHGDEDGHDHGNESEVISLVRLTFTPDGGGSPIVASFEDPDGDGGMSGSAEPITLASGTTYTLTAEFVNSLEDPPEDITEEIREEAEEHQVFIYGDAVSGPASAGGTILVTHAYDDLESDYGPNAEGDDLPVGLVNIIEATTAGAGGEFKVMLRHLPPVNGTPEKTAGLDDDFAGGNAIPGEVDVDVTFDLTVE